jgi:hypothetical protein
MSIPEVATEAFHLARLTMRVNWATRDVETRSVLSPGPQHDDYHRSDSVPRSLDSRCTAGHIPRTPGAPETTLAAATDAAAMAEPR